MRILIVNNPEQYRAQIGWINALQSIGLQTALWDERHKPAFDLFYEFNPHKVIVWTQNLTQNLVKALLKYKPQVYLGLNLFGPLPQQLGLPQASEPEKVLATSFPVTKVFTQYAPEYANALLGGWAQSPTPILPAHDIQYNRSKPFGLSYVGNWSPYKPLQWITDANKKHDIKVFGRGWFLPECLGPCTKSTEEQVLSGSNLVFYDYFEEWGLSDRIYNSLACGGNPIVQRTKVTESRFPNLNYFSDYDEMIDRIRKPKFVIHKVETYKERMEQLLG